MAKSTSGGVGFTPEFLKVLLLPAAWLLVVPIASLAFTAWGAAKIDDLILTSVESSIASTKDMGEEEKAAARAFYRQMPPSAACSTSDPKLQEYREAACSTGSDVWQFMLAERVSLAALVLAVFAIVGAIALGLVAFLNRNAQYWSFMAGWRGLSVISALEVAMQGVLLVFLSYWVTALLMERYVPKLILVVAGLAAVAVYTAVKGIFLRLPTPRPFDAEVVGPTDAPQLWRRVQELAARIGTPPPASVVAGIDDNFFVTEAGLPLPEKSVEGRALYVSLPLLRVLEPAEADAILSHELAHFQGGDTAASAKLGPALTRYSLYLHALSQGGMTLPAFFVMRLFRTIFELALKKEQRQRELVADATAAKTTSPDAIGKALLKVAGYSSFRAATETALFQHNEKHTAALGLKARIEEGLPAHVASAAFLSEVQSLSVPHPFDSHPPIPERLTHAGASVRLEDAPRLLEKRPEKSWVDDIGTAAAIEARLWGRYEAQFARVHEQSLAYRYLPATDEERALVEKHFPPMAFPLKDGSQVRVTHVGVELPNQEGTRIPFRDISGAKIDDGNFSTQLVITYQSPGEAKAATAKVNLKHLREHAEPFKAAFGHYWQRDQAARGFVASQGKPPA